MSNKTTRKYFIAEIKYYLAFPNLHIIPQTKNPTNVGVMVFQKFN